MTSALPLPESEVESYIRNKITGVSHIFTVIKNKGSRIFHDCYVYCVNPKLAESYKNDIYRETRWNIFPRFRLSWRNAKLHIESSLPDIAGIFPYSSWIFNHECGIIEIKCRNLGYALSGKKLAEEKVGWKLNFVEIKETEEATKQFIYSLTPEVVHIRFTKKLAKNQGYYYYNAWVYCANPNIVERYSERILRDTGWKVEGKKRFSIQAATKAILESIPSEVGLQHELLYDAENWDVSKGEVVLWFTCPKAKLYETIKIIGKQIGWYLKVEKFRIPFQNAKYVVLSLLPKEGGIWPEHTWELEGNTLQIKCYNIYPALNKIKEIEVKTGYNIHFNPVYTNKNEAEAFIKKVIGPENITLIHFSIRKSKKGYDTPEAFVFCNDPENARSHENEVLTNTGWKLKPIKKLTVKAAEPVIRDALPKSSGLLSSQFWSWDVEAGEITIPCRNVNLALKDVNIRDLCREIGWKKINLKEEKRSQEETEECIRERITDIVKIDFDIDDTHRYKKYKATVFCPNLQQARSFRDDILERTGWYINSKFLLPKEKTLEFIIESFGEAGIVGVNFNTNNSEIEIKCSNPRPFNDNIQKEGETLNPISPANEFYEKTGWKLNKIISNHLFSTRYETRRNKISKIDLSGTRCFICYGSGSGEGILSQGKCPLCVGKGRVQRSEKREVIT